MAEPAAASRPGQPPLSRLMEAKEIFLRIQPLSAEARIAELDRCCARDAALHTLVSMLLRGDSATLGMVGLDGIVAGSRATIDTVLGEAPGTVIGPYTLIGLIGEGGFGSVFLAEQSRPVRRQVALKILKAGMDTRQVVARFEQERQALAVMDHPGIAKVFDAGATQSGRPYFIMEYCTGQPITAFCDAHKLSIRARLDLFIQVCSAIQHAHHKGVIHRDIKPANILVDLVDNVPSAKVIDFGIAKATQHQLIAQSLHTQQHQLIGTPEYMSPEQAAGTLDIDTRTDVYSLGIVLYELLTGSTPFDAGLQSAAYAELHRIIRDTDPPAPSVRFKSSRDALGGVASDRAAAPAALLVMLRGDLDWVVMKAIEKERARRYDSAAALAADIQRYLANEPVLAAPQSTGYRSRKFVQRHKGPVIAGAAIALTMVAGLIGTIYGMANANQKAREARYESYIANMASGIAAIEADTVIPAREFLAACDPGFRNWEWNHASARTDSSAMLIDRRDEPLVSAGMNADATLAATLSAGGMLRTIDLRSGGVLTEQPFFPTSMITGVISSDGRRAIAASGDGTVRLFELASTGGSRDLAGHAGPVATLAFSSNGELAVGIEHDGMTRVWSTQTGALLASIPCGSPPASVVAVSNNGAHIAYAPPGRNTVKIHGTQAGDIAQTLDLLMAISSLAFSPGGDHLLVGQVSAYTRLFNVTDGSLVREINGPDSSVDAMAFSLDSSRIGLATWDGDVILASASGNSDSIHLIGNTSTARSIVLTPSHIMTATQDGIARAWELARGTDSLFAGHSAPVHSVEFSPDGEHLLSASEDGTARLWSLQTGREISTSRDPSGSLMSAAFSPDGSRFLTATADGNARIWNTRTGEQLIELPPGSRAAAHAVFSPDGATVVTVSHSGQATIWDAESGSHRIDLERCLDGFYCCVRFSTDGRRILAVGSEKFACVWDAATGRRLFTLEGHEQWLIDGAFSRDGSRIVTASEDRTVRIWDARDGTPLGVLHGHRGRVGAARFSPDGTRIFSVAGDSTLRVWDTARIRLLATFKLGAGYLLDLDVSPDGSRIAVSGASGTIRVLDSLFRHNRNRINAPGVMPRRGRAGD
ncbi:MAG: protein kinase [Phycisphaerales bacterium]|nr:protein kinase [Phycisphaerales bacterium]